MAIIDLYENFEKGENAFNDSIKEVFGESVRKKEKVVFLSHKSSDKGIAKKVAEALDERGYGVYLDENDKFLQVAVNENKKEKVVEAIKKGIDQSDHLLCIISGDTNKSWWVPYEIGIADSKDKEIVSLLPKQLNFIELPEFLEINKILKGKSDFMNHFKDERDNYLGSFYGNRCNYDLIFKKLDGILN